MFLLDEHLPAEVADIIRSRNPKITVYPLRQWKRGRLIGESDRTILREAAADGLVLVTFDVNTIPRLLQEMAMRDETHRGVVFISSRSFAQNDSKGIATALLHLQPGKKLTDWTNRVVFLSKKPPA